MRTIIGSSGLDSLDKGNRGSVHFNIAWSVAGKKIRCDLFELGRSQIITREMAKKQIEEDLKRQTTWVNVLDLLGFFLFPSLINFRIIFAGFFDLTRFQIDFFFHFDRMSKENIINSCKKNKLYLTPKLNDVLYLHYQGKYSSSKNEHFALNLNLRLTSIESATKVMTKIETYKINVDIQKWIIEIFKLKLQLDYETISKG